MTTSASVRPPLVLIPQHFGCLVFDRRSSRYLPFDAEATAILRALAPGPRGEPGASMTQLLASRTGDDERRAIFEFHACFAERGLFTLDGRFAGVALDVDPPPGHLTGPLAVHLEVIAACNSHGLPMILTGRRHFKH